MSEIRELLAAAQRAETRGDRPEATRLLRSAADWYEQRNLGGRAKQMLRQARRVAGESVELELVAVDDEQLGFGDELEDGGPVPEYELPEGLVERLLEEPALVEQRGPTLAPEALDAWCSFCCRPNSEVGAVVAGPAGAYICAGCVDRSSTLLEAKPSAPPVAVSLLPSQQRVLERLRGRKPRFALLFGPEGCGKSTVLQQVRADGVMVVTPPERPALGQHAQVVLEVRGEPPQASLVLTGPDGAEPIYETQRLASVVDLPLETLAHVDAVLVLAPATEAELRALAVSLLSAKGATLSDAALETLARLASAAGGVRELVALVSRVPAGRYA